MSNQFSSKALEANLAQTQFASDRIPDNQLWFCELSKDKWDIHKRTVDFIKELNHTYRNYNYVIESLHDICLEDLWFYEGLKDSEKAYGVLVDIFEGLFDTVTKSQQKDLLIRCLVKFIDRFAALEGFQESIVQRTIDMIREDMNESTLLYIQNSRYFKTYFNRVANIKSFAVQIFEITHDLVLKSIEYWEETSQVEDWFATKSDLFHVLQADDLIAIGKPFFYALRQNHAGAKDWESLQKLMFFNDISTYFRSYAQRMESHLETIHYLYYLLRLPGMAHYNKHLLYDINRNLRSVFSEINEDEVHPFIDVIMDELKLLEKSQGSTVLDCISTLGKEILYTGKQHHTRYFVTKLIEFGFVGPGILKHNNDWQTLVHSNHVKNIRTWIELIASDPKGTRELLAALIVNLKIKGIFISDTDLFQRDVTKLLNSQIAPTFREIKQLAKLFPIYFTDIGAEGKLREYSTAMDELELRKDRLIHFLRKQIHTESNNTHIELTKQIILYWHDRNPSHLSGLLPQDVMEWCLINTDMVNGVQSVMKSLCEVVGSGPLDILALGMDVVEKASESLNNCSIRDKRRVINLFRVYFLVMEKYSLEATDIIKIVSENGNIPDVIYLKFQEQLESGKNIDALKSIYEIMKKLKSIILDPEISIGHENIFYKRHVAAGIPSMYGQYSEPKFESLGLLYRMEKTASKLMVKIMGEVDYSSIDMALLQQIHDIFELFKDGLELDGISNEGFNSRIDMLKYGLTSPSFSLDQYINIFQFMARDIKHIIDEYFIDVYQRPLKIILGELNEKERLVASDQFFRDNLDSSFMVHDLDQFISEIAYNFSGKMQDVGYKTVQNNVGYDRNTVICNLEERTPALDNPVFLGAKAFFLKRLCALGFPVPSGFVLTTEVFRHKETIQSQARVEAELDAMIEGQLKLLEIKTGKRFGDPKNPLLLSVRSGSSFSLPGAMRTLLNVGINDDIAEVYSRRSENGWTVWDCYRRYLQGLGMAEGLDRDVFYKIIVAHKREYGVTSKSDLTQLQMKTIALAYKTALMQNGIPIEYDPKKQLKKAIYSVIESWFSEGAVSYRTHMEIAEEWGTAVLVQQMVLGNKSKQSGTGVVFTNSPFNDLSGIQLFGDFVLCSQGEDVVSGLVNTLPISESQRTANYEESSISLEMNFPNVYSALMNHAGRLIEQHGFVHQEIEFTFESDEPENLYILQTRNQKLKKKKEDALYFQAFTKCSVVGRGIGVNSGVISGLMAFDAQDIERLRLESPDMPVVLVRPYTVPDDIPLIFSVDAIVTAKGGITSHAAVTAASLGKVCIVNCRSLKVNETDKTCTFGEYAFKSGDEIKIDGYLGNIYRGNSCTLDVQ